MAVVDVLVSGYAPPVAGSTRFVDSIALAGGGDAYNQAIALAKLGHRTALATRLGADHMASIILDITRAHGIATEATAITDSPTIATVALIGADAERTFLTQRGLADEFPAAPLLEGLASQKPGVVSIGSLCWSQELDEVVLPKALAIARAAGAFTIADFVNDRSVHLDDLTPLLEQLDCIVPSLEEASRLTGTQHADQIARRFRAAGARNIVIKRSADGSIGYFGDDVIEAPALRVEPVDTTGAGDNFVAGFICGVLNGGDWNAALRFGAAAGALSTLAVGAGAGYAGRADVVRFLETAAPLDTVNQFLEDKGEHVRA
jgi:sugar/nucleoside kinase (ribokinase family)